MGIQVALTHRTSYAYDRPTTLGPQVVRLTPAPHCRTPLPSYALKVEPKGHFITWQQDPFSNRQARLVFLEPVRRLDVAVDLVADLSVINPFDFFLEPEAEQVPFAYAPELARDLTPYLVPEPAGPRLTEWLASVDRAEQATVTFITGLNLRLQREIRYIVRHEPGVMTAEEVLGRGEGSCRDTGWLLVQVLRHLGLAARFVSGYLIQLVADEKPLDGPEGPTADFTDLHAWAEVYLPGAGWVGLDPTSGLLAGEGHIPLACTPEPRGAAPITGTASLAQVDFSFAMEVRRIRETPRVTKPYDDASWSRLIEAGRAVDARLEAGDARLTMGGEPTFVAADDREAPEWTLDAVGPTKRDRGERMIRRLAERFAPGHLLHFGQGKWYPGEPLPRWGLTCIWRKDGTPVWRDPSLFADRTKPGTAEIAAAERFARGLAGRLGLAEKHLLPGFEDTLYYVWRERKLPVNVHPADAKVSEPGERERLARVLEGDPEAPVGYALPIKHEGRPGVWRSGPWSLRPGRLYLIHGDAPMGFRLPLESLPWVEARDYPYLHEPDPMAPRPPLPAYPVVPSTGMQAEPLSSTIEPEAPPPRPGRSDPSVVRTAMCVELREGFVHVFMPPLETAEAYLELAAAVEATAAELGQQIVVEGYRPPEDPRLADFSVTPDPGVLEINIHPAAGWDALVERIETVYAIAREERLASDRFLIDGRQVGTGGGNHLVVGGTMPPDSPFLRRPDLLKSLLGYWNNHPCLSYLFSGLFVGPTSQHPRVDEARHDSLHELEIAFQRVRAGETAPPWIVDRLFRHLLTDLTGNTHRAELCIDKLYAPESSGGRRGLVELRGFEMPPHPRMSLATQLLVRALIAWMWETPYERPLVRWGTRLHGAFMLPHYLEEDLRAVLRDLREAGFGLEDDWFAPHLAFRFPVFGTITRGGVTLELRYALEPWHTLGEQPAGGGATRLVDSSLERLQVRVAGLTEGRHRIGCNGWEVPLTPTGTDGEHVAGIRFRAWQPPHCLHPTIGVHGPLTFDIHDDWSGRSLGGCTYHVVDPGGRAYESVPVNANEAEARLRARFEVTGHSVGRSAPLRSAPAAEHPVTLDLRRVPTT